MKICANCSAINDKIAVKQEMVESGTTGEPEVVGMNPFLELVYDDCPKVGRICFED